MDVSANKFGSDRKPLLIQGYAARRHRFPRSGIPVSGVAEITLLAVKPRVNPGSGRSGHLLAEIVRDIPFPCSGIPKGFRFHSDPCGRCGIAGGGSGKFFCIHVAPSETQAQRGGKGNLAAPTVYPPEPKRPWDGFLDSAREFVRI